MPDFKEQLPVSATFGKVRRLTDTFMAALWNRAVIIFDLWFLSSFFLFFLA